MTSLTKPINDADVRGWLEAQITQERPFLLAFADDGVIWGKKVEGRLVTTGDIDPESAPRLSGETLQQAFVFGAQEEIRLFRDELGGWQTACLTDGQEVIKESQILWGDKIVGSPVQGFTHIQDLTKGIAGQWVPLSLDHLSKDECVRLDLHHNVAFDDERSEARIAFSRLAGLRLGLRKEVVR